jgi:excisionase family DNA binding protein
VKTAATTKATNSDCSVFDHSAPDAECLQYFLLLTNPEFSWLFPATTLLFGIILPNAAPTVKRAALRGKRSVGAVTMFPSNSPTPLALRSREAARMLGVSPRTLWEWTRAGILSCARIGTGKRRTVLYPLADLQAWLTRQAAPAKGGAQ